MRSTRLSHHQLRAATNDGHVRTSPAYSSLMTHEEAGEVLVSLQHSTSFAFLTPFDSSPKKEAADVLLSLSVGDSTITTPTFSETDNIESSDGHFTEEQGLEILRSMKRPRPAVTTPLDVQLAALREAGLLTPEFAHENLKCLEEYSHLIVTDEELPSHQRVQDLKQSKAQVRAESAKEAQDSELAQTRAPSTQRREMCRTDLLAEGTDTSTFIDAEALLWLDNFIVQGARGILAIHCSMMQDASSLVVEKTASKVVPRTVDGTDEKAHRDIAARLTKANKIRYPVRLHSESGALGAHSTIVPRSLLEANERSYTTEAFPGDRRLLILTENHLDEHIDWCARRYDNENVLLEQNLLMRGGCGSGLVPCDQDGSPMLGSAGMDREAARAVEDLLQKDLVLRSNRIYDQGAEPEEDPLVWTRTETRGAPKLAIVRKSAFDENRRHQTLGMWKNSQKTSNKGILVSPPSTSKTTTAASRPKLAKTKPEPQLGEPRRSGRKPALISDPGTVIENAAVQETFKK